MYGYDRIQPWFAENLRRDTTAKGLAIKGPEEVTKSMGIEYVAWWQYGISGYVFLNADRERFIGIQGYDRMVGSLRVVPGQTGKHYAGLGLTIQSDDKLDVITLSFGGRNQPTGTLRIGVGQLVERILRDSANSNFNQIPPEIYIEKRGASGKPVSCELDLFCSAERPK
jgi:hypothetical protein